MAPREITPRRSGKALRYASLALAEAAALVSEGIAGSGVAELQKRLDLTTREMSDLVSIPDRTLSRRKQQDRLPPDESERIYRIGRLAELAEAALGGRSNAVEWLKEPNFALGNRAPLEVAANEPGARLVEQVLGRIEHGITS
ncbi:MAG TPA: antitoxin Xre/MbcA/ParS toxin-binding domain-containing protein [Rhodothermales bacterium]|nr:antitoxin Xre/MbcA/ParS toxin-binding domain-containing protein [Rhodothermales bacterium]